MNEISYFSLQIYMFLLNIFVRFTFIHFLKNRFRFLKFKLLFLKYEDHPRTSFILKKINEAWNVFCSFRNLNPWPVSENLITILKDMLLSLKHKIRFIRVYESHFKFHKCRNLKIVPANSIHVLYLWTFRML